MDQTLTDVHKALSLATQATAQEQAMIPVTFKMDPGVKVKIVEICERHGTTLSEFLRQCCEGCIADYLP